MNELEDRRHRETTYTTPLHRTKDMKDFLQDFYRNVYTPQKKDHYSSERQKYPIVDIFYQQLCGGHGRGRGGAAENTATSNHQGGAVVSFEDFWQRYEYRCNVERIALEIMEQDTETRKKVASSIQGAWNSMLPKSPDRSSVSSTTATATSKVPDSATPGTKNSALKVQETTYRALDDAKRSLEGVWGTMTNIPPHDDEFSAVDRSDIDKAEQLGQSEASRLRTLALARIQVEEERRLKTKTRLEHAEIIAKAEQDARLLWEEEEARLKAQDSSESSTTSNDDDAEEGTDGSTETTDEDDLTPAASHESTGSKKVKKWKRRLAQKRHQRRESPTEEIEKENANTSEETSIAELLLKSSVSDEAIGSAVSANKPFKKASKKGKKSDRAQKWKKRLATKRADRNSIISEAKEDSTDDSSAKTQEMEQGHVTQERNSAGGPVFEANNSNASENAATTGESMEESKAAEGVDSTPPLVSHEQTTISMQSEAADDPPNPNATVPVEASESMSHRTLLAPPSQVTDHTTRTADDATNLNKSERLERNELTVDTDALEGKIYEHVSDGNVSEVNKEPIAEGYSSTPPITDARNHPFQSNDGEKDTPSFTGNLDREADKSPLDPATLVTSQTQGVSSGDEANLLSNCSLVAECGTGTNPIGETGEHLTKDESKQDQQGPVSEDAPEEKEDPLIAPKIGVVKESRKTKSKSEDRKLENGTKPLGSTTVPQIIPPKIPERADGNPATKIVSARDHRVASSTETKTEDTEPSKGEPATSLAVTSSTKNIEAAVKKRQIVVSPYVDENDGKKDQCDCAACNIM